MERKATELNANPSTEEMDQLRRSVKKHKPDDEEEEQPQITNMDMEQQTLSAWQNGRFCKDVQSNHQFTSGKAKRI